jgi:hypothetical protein
VDQAAGDGGAVSGVGGKLRGGVGAGEGFRPRDNRVRTGIGPAAFWSAASIPCGLTSLQYSAPVEYCQAQRSRALRPPVERVQRLRHWKPHLF